MSCTAIGALTRHHDVEGTDALRREVPLIAHAAGQFDDPQIRHRDTIGGSSTHADPASVLLTLDATTVARGADSARRSRSGVLLGPVQDLPRTDEHLIRTGRMPQQDLGVGLPPAKWYRAWPPGCPPATGVSEPAAGRRRDGAAARCPVDLASSARPC